MCGRFTLRTPAADWCPLFLPALDSPAFADDPPRYNIAPTQNIICVLRRQTGDDAAAAKMRWGLVPPWADDLAIGNRMINARSETVAEKPSFRNAFARRRCLIPADGYFEWRKVADGKQPYLIERGEGDMLAIAGLWEVNSKVSSDGPLQSCTILTTAANEATAAVHDRMPVFLAPEDFDRWLDPAYRDTDALQSLLAPAPNDRWRLTAVSRSVNRAGHDDPGCIEPIEGNDQ